MLVKYLPYSGYSHKTWEDDCRLLGKVFARNSREAAELFEWQGINPRFINRSLGDSSYLLVDDNTGEIVKEYKPPR